MAIDQQQLIASLERRFDYLSARALLAKTLSWASLPDQATYDNDEVEAFCEALERHADRVAPVVEHLRALTGAPATDEGAPPKAAQKKAAAEAKPKAAAEAKPKAVAEAKPKAEPKPKAKAKPKPPKEALVTFIIHETGTKPGQGISMCGDHEAIGAWKLERALVCTHVQNSTWRAELTLAAGTCLEFKFVKTNPDADAEWQEKENCSFEVPADKTATFETKW